MVQIEWTSISPPNKLPRFKSTIMAFFPVPRYCLLVFIILTFSHLQISSSSSFSTSLETLQKQIGYSFQSINLLRRAMTHPSYSIENYKTLSMLGLNTIQTSVSLRMLQKNPDISAKKMDSQIKAVSDVVECAGAGVRLGLEKVVRVSARTNASAPGVVCGAFRAVFGAVAVDCGKVEVAGDAFFKVSGPTSGSVSVM